MKASPFWTDDYPRPESLPVAVALPPAVDVAVVGAGITGLTAARRLARNGMEVAVLDTGGVGAGASTVNGGQVNYGLKEATSKVFKHFGELLGREFWDGSLRSIDLVEEIVTEDAIDCSFIRPGAAELGYTERDLHEFEAEAEWMAAKVGFDMEVVGPDRLHTVIGSTLFRCAAVDTVGASLHPARYTFGLAESIAETGAHIVEHAEVTGVVRNGAGYRLSTTKGEMQASEVLVATNGYTGPLLPQLRRGMIPVGSYVVATEPLRDDVAERLVPRNRAFWTARRFLNYFRRSPDNRILMGGRRNLHPDGDLTTAARDLGKRVTAVFPELADVPLTHSWTGRLAITFDLMPHIGRIEGIWYALGYGGHGVGIGTYVGDEVGGRIGGELDRSPFEEIPHPTKWYYRTTPWFLPFAATWYRFLDAIGR